MRFGILKNLGSFHVEQMVLLFCGVRRCWKFANDFESSLE